MQRNISKILGLLIAGLAVGHWAGKNGKLFGMMNVDKGLTTARVPIALSLLHAGFIAKDNKTAKTALASVGAAYIGMGMSALADRKLGGAAPKGLTNADIIFHLITGTAAIAAGSLSVDKS